MKASGIDLAPPSPSPDPRRGAPRGDARHDDFDGALEAAAEREPAERAEPGPDDTGRGDAREPAPPTAAAHGDGSSASAAALAASAAAAVAAAAVAKDAAAPGDARAPTSSARDPRGRVGLGAKDSSGSSSAKGLEGAADASGVVASEPPPDGARRAGAGEVTAGTHPARNARTAIGGAGSREEKAGEGAEQRSGSRDELAPPALAAAHPVAPQANLTPSSAATALASAGGPAAARDATFAEPLTSAALVRPGQEAAADGAVLRNAAHLRVAAPGVGELELHLRIRDGVAHVRVDGDAARVVESHAAELSRALAGEGLKLGQLDAKAPTVASSSAGSAHGDAASHHHRERGHERGETPPGTPPRPPRALGAASPLPAGRYAVRA